MENNFRLNKSRTLSVVSFEHLIQGNEEKKWFPELQGQYRAGKAGTAPASMRTVEWIRILALLLSTIGPHTCYSLRL